MATEKRCLSLLDSKENIVEGKAKLDGTRKGLCENTARKRLGDISNLPRQPKLTTCVDKAQFLPNTDKVCIDKLQKENMSLLEVLADKNKIIELSEIELQKMQQQNFQLAQANTMMLAELNAGKDRLKVMQHQLGCKNSLLIVKEMELEAQLKIRTYKQRENQVGTSKSEKDVMENEEVNRHQNNCCNNWKRQQKSLGHSIVKNEESNEDTENERVCLETQPASFKPGEPEPIGEGIVALKQKTEHKRGRLRKSAMFKHEEPEPKEEDMFEMTDTAKLSECPSSLNSQESSVSRSIDGKALGRPSIARPSRLAAKKVQSYKEIPLKVKLRRPE